MRLSVLQNDPGYSPDAFKQGVRILLDGVEVKDCVSADEEGGFVRCLDPDATDGSTIVKRGKVEIMIPPERSLEYAPGLKPGKR